jgi:sarcosine oxidase subunit beta
MTRVAQVVIVGAGIAGVSAAYHLAVRHGVEGIAIVDPRPPLTLTSDKSTECYRNWWPDAPMVGLMNRSIDILEELSTETDFGLNRNGYLFVTANLDRLRALTGQAEEVSGFGADADVLGASELSSRFGFLTENAVGALMVPRAGWFRVRDLGSWMLDRSRDAGARLVPAEVTSIERDRVGLSDGGSIVAPTVVIAAGPMSREVAAMAGVDLPLFSELHRKVAFKDHLGVIPRDAPMTIWSDDQTIPWSEEERAELDSMGRHDVLGRMPMYCHFRPEGGADSPWILALWEYEGGTMEPRWPLRDDPLYPEVVIRGLNTMIPGLDVYRDRLPESHVDGGYYTKTSENKPLIGPTDVGGIHLLVGLSGFGVMASSGAADLLARHITGAELPDYADAFSVGRYDDPDYLDRIRAADTGQL